MQVASTSRMPGTVWAVSSLFFTGLACVRPRPQCIHHSQLVRWQSITDALLAVYARAVRFTRITLRTLLNDHPDDESPTLTPFG